MPVLHYKKRDSKYYVCEDFSIQTGIRDLSAMSDFVSLHPDGVLNISKGYPWDGASGPTWDTDDSMIASLTHDGFYDLLRQGKLDSSVRAEADILLYRLFRLGSLQKINDIPHRLQGAPELSQLVRKVEMSVRKGWRVFRSLYWFVAVTLFAGRAAKRGTAAPVRTVRIL